MKLSVTTALIFLSTFFFLAAQDEDLDSFSFEEQDLREEQAPYFAVGGGFNLTFISLDMDEINNFIATKEFGLDELTSPMISYGGEFFTGIVFVDNMRLGFFWQSGSSTTSKSMTVGDAAIPVDREIDLSLTQSGVSVEFAYRPFRGVSLALIPGVSLGWGMMSLDSYQAVKNLDWNDINAAPDAVNYYDKVESSFYFSKFNLQLEYAFTTFVQLRLGAAYNLSFNYDWQYNNTTSLTGVPDGIKADGLQLQAGLHLGLFNY